MTSEFTNPDQYQAEAKRTECSQSDALDRLVERPFESRLYAMRLLHGLIGMMGELGELAGTVERWLWYGQEFDKTNFVEELGDSQWYMAELHNALDVSMLEVMRSNIRKLRKRYPEKFDKELAKEENRNREEEMKSALQSKVEQLDEELKKHESIPAYVEQDMFEQTGSGFAEPPEKKEEKPILENLCEDGWAVARKIANAFVEGQNRDYALRSIDSFEKQYNEAHPKGN